MVIQGYSFDFFRNLRGYKYPSELTLEEKNAVRNTFLSEISKLPIPLRYVPSYFAQKGEVDSFVEENLLSMGVSNEDASILYDDKSKIIITINDTEHLSFIGYTLDNPVKKYEELNGYLRIMSEDLAFQKDRNFGYLSSQIPLCGNGFMIDSIVHIPALMNSNKVMYMVNKTMRRPGALLIPYSDKAAASAFFIVRCISKTEPYKDINFIENIVSELEVKERAEAYELGQNQNFMEFLADRVESARNSGRISTGDFLRTVDDIILFRKIMGDEVQGEKIRNVLIKTQGTNISNMNFKHNEIEEYFYSLLFEDKEGLNA